MIETEPGHVYHLDALPGDDCDAAYMKSNGGARGRQPLVFVKRVGEKYPGNAAPPHLGTTTQEVIRALIARTKYVDDQQASVFNLEVIQHQRKSLRQLEWRARMAALMDAGLEPGQARVDAAWQLRTFFESREPETFATCPTCGHVLCARHGATP